MVVDHPTDDSVGAEQAAYANAEGIMYDILKQIWKDHYGEGTDRCHTPFKEFLFNKLQITPVGKIFDKEFGYRVEFNFEFSNTIDLASPPDAGSFIF